MKQILISALLLIVIFINMLYDKGGYEDRLLFYYILSGSAI